MDLVTETFEASCAKCKQMVTRLYHDNSKLICGTCRGRLKGTSPVLPCKLCTPPHINWYTRDVCSKQKNCGEHGSNDGGDSD